MFGRFSLRRGAKTTERRPLRLNDRRKGVIFGERAILSGRCIAMTNETDGYGQLILQYGALAALVVIGCLVAIGIGASVMGV